GTPNSGDSLTITSTGTYQPYLDQNRTVFKFTMTSGTLNLNSYTLTVSSVFSGNAGTVTNGKICPNGVQATYAGTTFSCEVNSVAGKVFLSGSTFNNVSYFEDTISNSSHNGNGGCTFNAKVTLKKNSVYQWGISNVSGNIFQDTAIFLNVKGDNFSVAAHGTTKYNGIIYVGCTVASDVQLGASGSSDTLASGKTINIHAATGFSAGSLRFWNFTQNGSTSQSLTLTGSSTINLIASTFSGAINFAAPHVLIKTSTLNGNATLDQTSATTGSNSDGGNTFNGTATIAGSGGSQFRLGITYDDIFNSDLTVTGSVNIGASNTTTLKGNLTAVGNDINFNNGGVTGTLKFAGSNSQHISSAGVIGFNKIKIDKSAGSVTLDSTITIDDTLKFAKGNFLSTANHLLSMKSGSTVTGASDSSYVEGPVKKTGSTAFIFPTGDNGFYRAVEISAPGTSSNAYTAQYYNEGQPYGETLDDTLAYLDDCNYFSLTRNSGSSNVYVTFYWNSSGCTIADTAMLEIASWQSSNWKDLGHGTITGNYSSGKIKTLNTVTAYGNFVFAYDINILPPATPADYSSGDGFVINKGQLLGTDSVQHPEIKY
ncbi:MAG: hypothetical protein ABI855_18710, partial [Bacteroidota bacterium]